MALRLLHLLALVILTIATAGNTSRGREGASQLASTERVSRVQVGTDSAVSAKRPLPRWGDEAARMCEVSVADLDDEEIDCDDDARSDVAGAPPAPRHGPKAARPRGRALRDEPQRDTSRFAVRAGLPRGPPA